MSRSKDMLVKEVADEIKIREIQEAFNIQRYILTEWLESEHFPRPDKKNSNGHSIWSRSKITAWAQNHVYVWIKHARQLSLYHKINFKKGKNKAQ